MNDPVNKPSHYYVTCPGVANDDGTVTVECRHVMHGLGLNRNFMTGAAFKYLWRCLKKANTVEDIQKARRCLEYALDQLADCSVYCVLTNPAKGESR